MNKKLFVFLFVVVSLSACGQIIHTSNEKPRNPVAKFEPADGRVLLFVGQELEAIGGTDAYHDGYYDHFPAPAGFTHYTDFITVLQNESKPRPGLQGLTTLANWGDGPENMSLTANDPDFKNSCLAIGLDMSQGNDSTTAAGGNDHLIIKLGQWINRLGNRPVFLRLGYEFDGHDWNHYKPGHYKSAWIRVHNKMDSMGVNNIAYVWQSKSGDTKRSEMDEYYPGDDYVDWVAFSYFEPRDSAHPMLQFAHDHKKPLFIAESSPVILDSNGVSKPLDLTRQADAEWAWKEWFEPFFRTIRHNQDVVKALHYINANWQSRSMWKDNPFFSNVDARITHNSFIKNKWLEETAKPLYLKASDTLFNHLWNREQH